MHFSDLHTLFNYFTVALVTSGIVFEIIGRNPSRTGYRDFGWKNFLLGFGFALLSAITGFLAEGSAYLAQEAKLPEQIHRFLSLGAILFMAIIIIFRLIFGKKMIAESGGSGLRGAYVTLQLITICLTLGTAILGIRLVKGLGVGVDPYETIQRYMPPPAKQNGIEVDTTQYRN
jgi:uncharacterized membrane protein